MKDLAREMRMMRTVGSPVAWMVPTTINTPALNTEDKRHHMKEEDMEIMRGVYAEAGVLSSASFVLDGPSFTADRVLESYDGVHYPPQVYDAGAQILANAMDWLLPEKDIVDLKTPPQPGQMANPYLGMMMLCFVFIGLMFFDGFVGFSYFASLFVKGVMPNDLYEEAFTDLHRKMKLPAIKGKGEDAPKSTLAVDQAVEVAESVVSRASTRHTSASSRQRGSRPNTPSDASLDDEIRSLLGSEAGNDVEMASKK